MDDVLAGRGAGGLGREGILLIGDCWTEEEADETARVLIPEETFILSAVNVLRLCIPWVG